MSRKNQLVKLVLVGFGTSGGTVIFGVRENNYLGKGLSVNTNFTVILNPSKVFSLLETQTIKIQINQHLLVLRLLRQID